ncbi:MAG: NYN domain-containing protein [Tissierellia bacterium]|nr:NYN domain-containing protein [Tissierellia bacterium]
MLLKYKRGQPVTFVDGYNIINDWPELKELAAVDLEQARDKLVDQLTEYAHLNPGEVILVFDAYRVKGTDTTVIRGEDLTVVYTKEHQTADHFIEEEVHGLPKSKEILVASSDQTEQQLILSRGGSRVSAREFRLMVEGSKQSTLLQAKYLKREQRIHNRVEGESAGALWALRDQLEEE